MHMHTLKIAIMQPAQPFEFSRLVEEVLARLAELPPLRRRVLPPPFRLHHPLWIADRPVDPAQHLFEHQVPAPGGMSGLEALIGTVAGTPLDRSRPLWEMHVCQPFERRPGRGDHQDAPRPGRRRGRQRADVRPGRRGRAPTYALPATGRAAALELEETPGRLAQVRSALWGAFLQIGSLPGLLSRTGSAVTSLVRHKRTSSVEVPRPILDAPRTPFNRSHDRPAQLRDLHAHVAEFKEVQRANGVTMNDVVLATVGGAVRRWLSDRRAPGKSLVAGVPVATDRPGAAPRLGGTRSRTCSPSSPPTSRTRRAPAGISRSRSVQDRAAHAGSGHARSTGSSSPRRRR